ncbi:amino acid/amide ABC transporter substrate-binding protein (HAAT family) [Microvirgula sp. AG722]|uniref:branched-chain amino acid ABC transporter substrate-binding protein n=1 Tax=Microvirgula sp. AG722 TaxID=2183901 RepID=UPI000DC3C617|nr:branched-chain amino acid ABC transporter substrate-binding protein [Microvirgula sp. AG722]RAS15001.1 amino acid/amide ABC transporter substrate-binding protein (HAAT family) [Microvirgula sp. AG722]
MNYARLSLIAAAIATLAACGQKTEAPKAADQGSAAPAAAEETVVKIGTVAPLTGPIAHLGKDIESGVKLAVDEINAEGTTIDGKKVKFEVESEDDQADPKIATQVAQRLVDKKVVGIIGHLNSGTSIPASKIYADAGIPQVSPASTNPGYTTQGFKTTYRDIANDVQQGKALGAFAVDKQAAKTVAVIDDRTAYGQGIADEFVKAAEAKGAKVVKREFTTNTATDFMAILTSIKGAKPDLVFYGGMDAQGGPLAKQMNKLGMKSKLLGADGLQSPEFLKLAGDTAEGVYASSVGMPKDKMPGFASFNEKFAAKYGEVQIYSPYAYDATKLLVAAMKRANSTDPAKYIAELPKTDYKGVTGTIAFDDKGDIKNGAVTVFQVKGGKWETLETVGGDAPAK